jgi:hypothetical protein
MHIVGSGARKRTIVLKLSASLAGKKSQRSSSRYLEKNMYRLKWKRFNKTGWLNRHLLKIVHFNRDHEAPCGIEL